MSRKLRPFGCGMIMGVARVNVDTLQLGPEFSHGDIGNRGVAVGDQIGASRIGAAVYQVQAGRWVWPFHYHHGVEEWLLVLSGTPVMRERAGQRTLAAGDLVCWPSGVEGVHTVGGPGRFMIFSVGGWPEASIAVYPDSGQIGARPGDVEPAGLDRLNFRREDAVDYWGGRGPSGALQIVEPPLSGEPLPVVSLREVALAVDAEDPPGFRGGYARLGPLLGATRLGATLYEFEPGEGTSPYHYEYGREEWGLVLSGAPTLRTPAGSVEVGPGDLDCFVEGPAGAHRYLNHGSEPARVLIFSTKDNPAVAVYPDSGKVGVFTHRGASWIFREPDGRVDYWDGET